MNSGNWGSFKHSDPVSSLTDNECNDGSVSFSYIPNSICFLKCIS